MEKFKIKQFKYSEVWESVHTDIAAKLKVKRQAYIKTDRNKDKMGHEWAIMEKERHESLLLNGH